MLLISLEESMVIINYYRLSLSSKNSKLLLLTATEHLFNIIVNWINVAINLIINLLIISLINILIILTLTFKKIALKCPHQFLKV